ncbi:MAG: succinate dehydrogenase, hydrophobic membrane anchor protein [Gammaproteobacteria bacterium]|nr:succinate dehydrogenase, hydrophobic membrane anchor protein [Gammaproteobacteria bacterium]
MSQNNNLRNPLARVKGLGASGQGSHHWWVQRLSAIALIPLSLWFVFSIVNKIDADHATVLAWVSSPGIAVMLLLYLMFMFFHAQLGLQVVIEDYVHNESAKMIAILLVKAISVLAAVASLFAVLRIAL